MDIRETITQIMRWKKDNLQIFTLKKKCFQTIIIPWDCYGAMETPQHGNVSTRKCLKNRFWGISVFLGEIPQNWKMLRDFRIFLRRFLIFKVEVFPLFFEAFPLFLRHFRFLKKVLKLYFVEAFPLFLRRFCFLKKVLKLFSKNGNGNSDNRGSRSRSSYKDRIGMCIVHCLTHYIFFSKLIIKEPIYQN